MGVGEYEYGYDTKNQRVYSSVAVGACETGTFFFYGIDGKKLAVISLPLGTVGSAPCAPTSATVTQTNVWFAGRLLVPEDRLQSHGKYFPYGAGRTNPNPANPPLGQERFATYTRDSGSGLDYAYQRYYANGLGRFLTTDRKDGSARPYLPQTWNRYSYAGDDPANNSDPSGNSLLNCPGCNQVPGAKDNVVSFEQFGYVSGDGFITTAGADVSSSDTSAASGGSFFDFTPTTDSNAMLQQLDAAGMLAPCTPADDICGGVQNPNGILGISLDPAANLGIAAGLGAGLAATDAAVGLVATGQGAAQGTTFVTSDVTFTHFTDSVGLNGITGLDASALSSGESVTVGQLNFGFGTNGYLAGEAGDIFVTDLPATTSPLSLSQVGVYGSRQSFGIQFSGEQAASQGVIVQGQGSGIFTIPGGSTLNGCFTVYCR